MPGAKILTIDDEWVLRKTLVAYLEDSDFEVLEADNGRNGLDLTRQHHPDLILCDLMMPEMDGMEFLEIVTREFPDTPIVMISGMNRLSDAINALKLGAWDYITKPIEDMAVLEHAINQTLERAELLRNNRQYHRELEASNRRLEESLTRLRADEEAGRRLQFQLLPEDHKLYGEFQFSRHLLTSLYLSGDFVDYFFIDNNHLGFYIADVSGHGVPSAFVTVLLKSYMSRYLELYRQHKNEGILNPARVLKRLNHNILSGGLDKYLTMFFGIINIEQNRLYYANGGQFPQPLLFDGSQVEVIGSKGLPVGLFDFAEYQTESLELPPRFTMTMISDGILETLPQPTLRDKLAHLASVVSGDDGSIESLIQRLGLDRPLDLPDDVTVLRLRREN